MTLEEKQVILRKLIASEGKIIVSKEINEEGIPTVIIKELYLGKDVNENDFQEVDENLYKF